MIYEGACTCKESYTGETRRNVDIKWEKREDTQKDSELVKHVRNHSGQSFTWKVLLSVSKMTLQGKIWKLQ